MGKSSRLPDYVTEWMHQRVHWWQGPLKGKQGTVTDVERVTVDRHERIFVNVLRDDGFLEPKVDVNDLHRIRDGNYELVKSHVQ